MSDICIRSMYSPRVRVALSFDKANSNAVSRTQQHFKKECDINNLMAKYMKTGLMPQPVNSRPYYGDFTQVGDFQDMQNKVLLAEREFMRIPANIRERFGNNPASLLNFLADTANDEEAVKLGLKKAKKPEAVVTPAGEPAKASA